MMSIFSPPSSLITARTLAPIGPMQAPLALTPAIVGLTEIFDRCPASLATAVISTEPSEISQADHDDAARIHLRVGRHRPGDQVVLATGEVAERPLVVDVAQALQDDL